MSVHKIPFRQFKTIYSKVPRLTVEVLVIESEGIALSLRDIEPYKGQWHIPGGTILFGETIKQAVQRVAKEELGVKVKVLDLLGIIEYPSEKTYGAFTMSVGLAYRCTISTGKIKGCEQGKEVRFFSKLPKKLILDQKIFLRNTLFKRK